MYRQPKELAVTIEGGKTMMLSRRSIETLLDLVDSRIDAFHIHDIADALELRFLEQTRFELREQLGTRDNPHHTAQIVPLFPEPRPSL